MTQRLGELPEIARDRATEAADSLRRGLDGLNAAAIAAAEEAQEIDAAFQARIRQNYELLSEFMLHMGTVAGGRRTSDLGLNEIPAPLSRTRRRSADPAPEAEAPDVRDEAVASTEEMNTPLKGSEPKDEPRADNSVGFPERGGRKPADPGWRWKELLASMPSDEGDDTARDALALLVRLAGVHATEALDREDGGNRCIGDGGRADLELAQVWQRG